MDFINAIILGIVEGFTEFLPISSTGHLIIVNRFITFSGDFTKMFDIVIQLGAVLAVVVYFWKRINPFDPGKTADQKKETWSLWSKALVGIIPVIILGAVFGKIIQAKLFNPLVVAITLFLGGVILIVLEMRKSEGKIHSIHEIDYKTALLIGFIQCLAMIPGTSRSAATIIGGMLLGLSRGIAAEFSFFLAIPTMVAASGYMILKTGLHLTVHEWLVLAVGFVVSFLVAWAVVAAFMDFIRRKDFKPFGVYRIVLAIVVVIYFGINGILI